MHGKEARADHAWQRDDNCWQWRHRMQIRRMHRALGDSSKRKFIALTMWKCEKKKRTFLAAPNTAMWVNIPQHNRRPPEPEQKATRHEHHERIYCEYFCQHARTHDKLSFFIRIINYCRASVVCRAESRHRPRSRAPKRQHRIDEIASTNDFFILRLTHRTNPSINIK